ncbi:uncharacterized protein Gcw-chp [Breznakibacter xylanolyticus]|uniref:Uncharacterized protein Gcw-chp n=1 Tax=Breznakibacter xylanolyticus TaxID=990 RepID=A0A2W7NGY1_9BACT|nr:TorF family putative porin [Breznakibacter xylanolyticus]PZX17457.1 uncharacterized protein Gcw-chp [Breznakibacter xylanolyticus]
MKRVFLSFAAAIACMATFAQESEATSPFSISADVVSRYVWRGSEIGGSPNIQPGLSYSIGGLTAGAWGSYDFDFSKTTAAPECDLYLSYDFEFGLGFIATDYYNQSFRYFDYDGTTGAHSIELGLTYSIGNLSLGAYKFINQSEATYVEAAYEFKNAKLFVGAGDKSYYLNYTEDFNICNVGLTVGKEVQLTETWKVAPYASFVVNPNKEEAFLVLGITL